MSFSKSKFMKKVRCSIVWTCFSRGAAAAIISYDIISYDIISYDIISYDIISYDIISYDIISYDIIWYDKISYDTISHDMIAAADAAAETYETNGKPKLFQEFWLWKMTLKNKTKKIKISLKEPQENSVSNDLIFMS